MSSLAYRGRPCERLTYRSMEAFVGHLYPNLRIAEGRDHAYTCGEVRLTYRSVPVVGGFITSDGIVRIWI